MGLKQILYKNKVVYGTWCLLPSAEVINVIAKSGMDFVIIDQEHGAIDSSTAYRMVMAAQADHCYAFIRVGDNDELKILQALDVGADGIIIPHIDSLEEAKKAVSYTKYPPIGIRGFSPYTRSGGYANMEGYTQEANDKNVVGVIIEGKNGIDSVDKIASLTGIDILYIGTYDISSMLGIPGDVTNPRVVDVIRMCTKKIIDAGKIPGCMFSSCEELKLYDEIGVTFRVYSVDSTVIYESYNNIIGKIGGDKT